MLEEEKWRSMDVTVRAILGALSCQDHGLIDSLPW
jgi:hypothetical protein